MASPDFLSAAGTFRLERFPQDRSGQTQAWNAADALLVAQAAALPPTGGRVLVANDEFGALCLALSPDALWTDSALTEQALAQNLLKNSRDPVEIIKSTVSPGPKLTRVVMRVPKQLAYFEYQLARLAALLPEGAQVLAGGMDKHLSPRVTELLEATIGPTERHRGQRKARIFTATRDNRGAPPVPVPAQYHCDMLGAELVSLPNVFSRDDLDIGTRFLLEQLHHLESASHGLDLACGNGVLGLAALHAGICESLSFCDESAMAVESARLNTASLLPQQLSAATFYQDDGCKGYSGPAPQLILCNPPFHSHHQRDEAAGRRLIAQAADVLAPGGRLCLVANQHLKYLPVLRRNFSRHEELARNRKFVVWLAEKS